MLVITNHLSTLRSTHMAIGMKSHNQHLCCPQHSWAVIKCRIKHYDASLFYVLQEIRAQKNRSLLSRLAHHTLVKDRRVCSITCCGKKRIIRLLGWSFCEEVTTRQLEHTLLGLFKASSSLP